MLTCNLRLGHLGACSKHFEKLHEISRGLLEDLQGVPEWLLGTAGTEEKKKLKDLVKLHRQVRSTPLTATPGGRGDVKYGACALENERLNRLQSQRALLLQGTESLNRATQSPERSHWIATETDQLGREIIEELGVQREQLGHPKNKLVNPNENLSKCRKILHSMSRKATTNKLLLSIVIFWS
ncbi:hypothetical protein U0070_007573 [Myodes glareolus]|uniref:Uncharacterized protein n=1 Tax=Myodes glareolus TaxID=447135 RepID=A0AAW0I476_MYOGA